VNPGSLLFRIETPLVGNGHGAQGARMTPTVESGGVLGLTGNYFGRRQRVEGHPLVKRVKANLTADNNYALAA
jgi:hypothetical protein